MNMFSERVTYTNWARYEPNNYYWNGIYRYIDYDHCVRIRSGEWYDTPCSFTLPALCSQRYNIGKCSECRFKEAVMVNKSPHMIYQNKFNVIFLVIYFYFIAKTYKRLWFGGRKWINHYVFIQRYSHFRMLESSKMRIYIYTSPPA